MENEQPSNNVVEVGTAQYCLGRSPQVLRTAGIGSCIVVCLYDSTKKIGGLAHIMLPQQTSIDLAPSRYVNTAVPLMLNKLKEEGVNPLNLKAQIYGGANMFPNLWSDQKSIGAQNIVAARRILAELGIPISEAITGGTQGRNLEFILESGSVVLTAGQERKT